MASRALVQRSSSSPPVLAGELVDADVSLAAMAAEVAARQRSPETRRTYAAVYRAFSAFLGPDATAAELTPEAVRAYRDALERAGRSPATVAKQLSALRGPPTRWVPTTPPAACAPQASLGASRAP